METLSDEELLKEILDTARMGNLNISHVYYGFAALCGHAVGAVHIIEIVKSLARHNGVKDSELEILSEERVEFLDALRKGMN